jgi:hypothetical protein
MAARLVKAALTTSILTLALVGRTGDHQRAVFLTASGNSH